MHVSVSAPLPAFPAARSNETEVSPEAEAKGEKSRSRRPKAGKRKAATEAEENLTELEDLQNIMYLFPCAFLPP